MENYERDGAGALRVMEWRERARQREDQAKIKRLRRLALTLAKSVESLEEAPPTIGERITFYDEVRRFEISLIERALQVSRGQQKRAAELLGLNHTTLNAFIKRYNIPWKTWNDDLSEDLPN